MVEITSVDDADGGDGPAVPLAVGDRMNAQYVEIDPGTDDDPHSHPHEQFTYVQSGTLTLVIGGEAHDLSAGDSLVIPGGTPHFARNEGEEAAVLLDVFSPVREGIL
jgi:quercetin dioxygenase-like cupin family protein